MTSRNPTNHITALQNNPLCKPKRGDLVALVSPSSTGPAIWPQIYELGVKKLESEFGVRTIDYPSTLAEGLYEDKVRDLRQAFSDTAVKAVISTLGGKCEIEYVSDIDPVAFSQNEKPFFGFSDNTHLCNFLWLNGTPSFYGGGLFTQFARNKIDDFTKHYLATALFETGRYELSESGTYVARTANWNDLPLADEEGFWAQNEGWVWDGEASASGVSWGGCIESIDELLSQDVAIPSLEDFRQIVLLMETAEGIPTPEYCSRVVHELGRRGILANIRGILCGRPQAWFFDKQLSIEEQALYQASQRNAILSVVREYNTVCPVVQNLDFGHTNPQIPIPYGKMIHIDTTNKKIFAEF